MKALSGSVQDNSLAMRQSFSVAVGYMFKYSSAGSQEKLIKYLYRLYTEKDDSVLKSAAVLSMHEISKHSSDVFKQFEDVCMSLAYYGMHDTNEDVKKVWTDVWQNNTGDVTTAL